MNLDQALYTENVSKQGWYIICYGFGIYVLNLLIGFLTPQFAPGDDEDFSSSAAAAGSSNDTELPLGSKMVDGEFKPFIRKLGEFSFWYSTTKALIISLFLTISRITDIPVFWYT